MCSRTIKFLPEQTVTPLFENWYCGNNQIKFLPGEMSPAQDFILRTIKSLPELILTLWRIEMTRVFEGKIHVDYNQAYVLVGEIVTPDLYDAFRGQTNGICGAAVRGALWLITGLHTGRVGCVLAVVEIEKGKTARSLSPPSSSPNTCIL